MQRLWRSVESGEFVNANLPVEYCFNESFSYYPTHKDGGTASSDCANVRVEGDQFLVEVGPIFKRDESQRRHSLEINRQD